MASAQCIVMPVRVCVCVWIGHAGACARAPVCARASIKIIKNEFLPWLQKIPIQYLLMVPKDFSSVEKGPVVFLLEMVKSSFAEEIQ